ncbi:MAG: pyridoxine 5'-phosphate synthase, partial [Bacteroidales bacterium]|nr:pyridoxine 5'-phosphate synthase [Bacteroidales bacterium]
AAKAAEKASLGLNAGHDLNLENLEYFKNMIPNLLEVSIGHALICDSLYYGIKNTVELYKRCLK